MPTSPTSGPGGGGGGVTAPVVIPSGGRAVVPLSISGAPTQDANFFEVEGTGSYFELQADGAGNIDRVDVLADRYRISTDNTNLSILDDGWSFSSPEVLFFNMATAPPDVDFGGAPGFALWLDSTPGATKLMIKALDTIGTFRTAAITLS